MTLKIIRRKEMSEVIEAVKEASISLACLLDDGEDIKLYTLEKDVEHILFGFCFVLLIFGVVLFAWLF